MIYRNSSPRPTRLLLKVAAGVGVAATALACSQGDGSDSYPETVGLVVSDAAVDAEFHDAHVFGVLADSGADLDAEETGDAAPGVLADAQPDVDSQ